jgi:hypothetical protein
VQFWCHSLAGAEAPAYRLPGLKPRPTAAGVAGTAAVAIVPCTAASAQAFRSGASSL